MSETVPTGLPEGLVTFLFTDVAGSTRLWEDAPQAMSQAMREHDSIVEDVVAVHQGHLVRPRGEGDSRFAVFARPSDAVSAATALQQQLLAHTWTTPGAVTVRAAVHTGEADLRDGDYYGRSVNRAARLRAVGHPSQVLVSGATHDLVQDTLAGAISLRPLGTIELADLERPEPVYQVQHPLLPTEFPALRSSTRPVVKLPPLVLDFVGRAALVTDIDRRLAAPDCRLITLIGPGGVGKTQVGIAVALSARTRFGGGVFFVSLADVSSSAAALYAIAAVAEVRETPSEDLLVTVSRSLASAPVLLVLDNGEQVQGLDGLVNDLLGQANELAVITTSRSPLRLRMEQRVPVPPLETPTNNDSELDLAKALDYPAIALFVRRAKAVDPDLVLDAASLASVVEICQRLEGSPLSLELAAARADILDVEQIKQRLSEQLTLLSSHQADLPPRQRTLRATLEWSASLLKPTERSVLFRLAQMVGPFTLEDVSALIAEGDQAQVMSTLVDSSLVQVVRTTSGRQFQIADAVREFGLLQLGAQDLLDVRLRLLTHVSTLAHTSTPALQTTDAPQAVTQLRRRYEDVRSVIESALAHGQHHEVAPLLSNLRRYWIYDGQLREPHTWVERWLESAPETEQHQDSIELTAGVLAYLLDDGPGAVRRLRNCVASNDVALSALAHGYLGAAVLGQGDVERASQLASTCEELAGHSDDYEAQSLALSLRAVIAAVTGDIAAERGHYLRRLELSQQQGDDRRVAETLNNLAEVCLAQDDLASAQTFSQQALSTARGCGRVVTRDAVYTQARVDLLLGDDRDALVHAREALRLSLDLGQRFEVSQAVTLIGAIAIAMGREPEGAELMAAGQHLRLASGAPLDVDLEPEFDNYRKRAATVVGAEAFDVALLKAASTSLESIIQLAMRILPTR